MYNRARGNVLSKHDTADNDTVAPGANDRATDTIAPSASARQAARAATADVAATVPSNPSLEQTLAGGGTSRGASNPALEATAASLGQRAPSNPAFEKTVRPAGGLSSTGSTLDDYRTPPRGTVVRVDGRPPLRIGQRIAGRYTVQRALGSGGMGLVFAAVDETSGDTFALKVMKPEMAVFPAMVRQFRHEYRLMATLRHPHLIGVRDFVLTAAGLPCIVMEHIAGDDLSRRLPLPWPQATKVLYQVCSALAFLHVRGYIHHDIKPSNVRLRDIGDSGIDAKLIDFGVMEPLGAMVEPGQGGTPIYLPPEALVGAPTDHRLDLYGLGVMAFEIITGRLPFTTTDDAVFVREKHDGPPGLRESLGDSPDPLADLIADLMSIRAGDRPYDAAVVLRRLTGIADCGEVTSPVRALPYLRPSWLVGRAAEIDTLEEEWTASAESPRLVLVRADAGAGKTALLREMQLRVRMQDGQTIEDNGRGGQDAYGLLLRMQRRLIELGAGRGDIAEDLRAHLPYLTRIFPALADEYDRVAPERHQDPTEDRLRLHDALRAWIRVLLEDQRIALILDDVHAADAASVEALVSLCSDPDLRGLLVVAAYRPDSVRGDTPMAKLSQLADTGLDLPPLSDNQVADLLEALFGPVDAYPRFVSSLARAGRGNPQFLIEIIGRLIDNEQVRFEDERWTLPRELGSIRLPDSLGEALMERLGTLGPEARQIAAGLAVANRDLAIEELRQLCSLDEADLSTALDELIRTNAVERHQIGYRLSRGFPRREFYDALSSEVPPSLHLRAGELLEDQLGPDPVHRAVELAEHFRLGDALDKAKKYLAMACAHLYEIQALRDAIAPLRHLEEILVGRGADTARADSSSRQLLQVTRERLARIGLAVDLDLSVRYFPLERQALLPHAIGKLKSRSLIPILGREAARGLLSPRRLTGMSAKLSAYFVATTYHAVTLMMRGEFAAALRVAEELKPFIMTRRSPARAGYEVCRAVVFVHQGRVAGCESALEIAVPLLLDDKVMKRVPEMDRITGLAGVYSAAAQMWAQRGHPNALKWLDRLRELNDSAKVRFLLPNLFIVSAEYYLCRGELDDVWEIEEAHKRHHARAGHYSTHLESQLLAALARAHLSAHNLIAAEAYCAELGNLSQDFFTRGWGACIEGELWRRQRLLDRSRDALATALSYATRPDEHAPVLEMRTLCFMARVAMDRGDHEEASRAAQRQLALASAQDTRSEHEEVLARRILARIADARGETTEVARHIQSIEALAVSADNPLFVAIASALHNEL